ncbi:hypothetical protein ACHAXM_009201 [Skeletonema potamos]
MLVAQTAELDRFLQLQAISSAATEATVPTVGALFVFAKTPWLKFQPTNCADMGPDPSCYLTVSVGLSFMLPY